MARQTRDVSGRPTKLVLGGAAVVAAGVVAARALNSARERELDRWEQADGDDPIDPLAFPDGADFRVSTSDGAELVGVDVAGDGPPVLLIHGFTGTRGHWGPVATALAEAGHRVLAYEQRGHGGSTVGDSGFSMTALGNDLRAVLEHLDLRDVTICGHSMGGMALQSYVGNHPESARNRVRLAVLTSTAAMPTPLSGAMHALAPKVLGSPLVERALAERRKGSFGLRSIVGTEVRLSHLDAARRTVLGTAPDSRVGAYLMLRDYDLRPVLETFDVPTIIAVGTHDELTPIDRSRELDELIPHAELHVFPGAGHMLPWERSAELTDLIARSIDKVATDGAPVAAGTSPG